MKDVKKIFLVFMFLISFYSFINFIFASTNITSMAIYNITGMITSNTTGLALMVDANAPDVNIIYPLNETYNYKDDIALEINYSDISDISAILYNLDNTANTSISGNITFNTDEGSHTLYVYVNDTYDFLNNSESVTFFVNTSMGHEIDLSDDFNGDSTDIENLTREEQENISNLTFHHLDYGKIIFNDNINLTEGIDHENGSRYIINISRDVIIENNRIFVSITELPNFNKSTTLTLYNLTFTDPRIIRDDEICPSDICIKESYSDGTLVFNVTGFSEYKAEESPGSGTTPYAAGGGSKKVELIKPIEEVKEEKVLEKTGKFFTIKVNVPKEYKKVPRGSDLKAEIKIDSIENLGKVEGLIIHKIKDLYDNILMEEYKFKLLNDGETFFVQKIRVPEDFELGKYILVVDVRYNGEISFNGADFEVTEKVEGVEKIKRGVIIERNPWIIIGIGLIVIGVILAFHYIISRFNHKEYRMKI